VIQYPKLDDRVDISPLETSSISQVYLLKTSDGRTFQISSKLYQLLRLLDGQKSLQEIASQFSSQNSKKYRADDISQIIERLLIPQGFLVAEQAYQGIQPERRLKSNGPLSLRIPLFSQKALLPLSGILSKLFYRPVFVALSTMAFIILWVNLPSLRAFDFTKTIQMSHGWIMSYVLLSLSVVFHELGHASACRYYRCLHGPVGFGLYLVFPVFYVDINDAWRLSRKQRAIVDIGGVYFQFVTTIVLFFVYMITQSPIFLMAIFLTYLMIFINLNPLFKYDGYWLLSDVVGIPNLRKRATELAKHLVKKEKDTTYQLSQIPSWAKAVLFSYTVLSNAFFIYFVYRMTEFLAELLKKYPTILAESVLEIRQSFLSHDVSTFFVSVSQIIFPLLLSLSVILMSRKLLYPAFRYAKNIVTRQFSS
jgi:putative peptide zinc metalloprotease protein